MIVLLRSHAGRVAIGFYDVLELLEVLLKSLVVARMRLEVVLLRDVDLLVCRGWRHGCCRLGRLWIWVKVWLWLMVDESRMGDCGKGNSEE